MNRVEYEYLYFLPDIFIVFIYFFFNDTATTEIYTLSLHDALPIFDIGSELDIHGIWGSSPHNIYAVADSGHILNYDGSQWTKLHTGYDLDFYAIWGTAGDNIFISGEIGRAHV